MHASKLPMTCRKVKSNEDMAQPWLSGNGCWLFGCRAPALQVLAMNLTRAPNLAMGLLASAGASLQHLQLVMAGTGAFRDGFWRAVKGCTELAALQLVFMPVLLRAIDNQVAFEGGSRI